MEHRRANAGLILGSYAAFPPLGENPNQNSASGESGVIDPVDTQQAEFQRRVRDLPYVSGLELPFSRLGLLRNSSGVPAHEQLGFGWKLVVTFLPAQMENMELDPHFGLASARIESRQAACAEVRRMMTELQALLKLRPDIELLGVSLPSGPRVRNEGAQSIASSAAALRASMNELKSTEYFSKISFEHCDSKSGVGPVAKGFLSLEDEQGVAREFGLGVVINWGRSALDGRSAEMPVKHLEQLQLEMAASKKPSLLRGLILSGSAIRHPDYGDWLDTHAPIREAYEHQGFETQAQDLGNDSRLLLTLSEARRCWDLACRMSVQTWDASLGAPPPVEREADKIQARLKPFVGLKVQPLPRSMDVDSRLKFLERHLEELHAVLGLGNH